MKIIDLLNKIANGEEVPKKIIYDTFTYWYDELEKDYYKYVAKDLDDEDIEYLLDNCFASDILNDEVEIIEEDKKIEKINIKWDKDYYVLDENNDKRYINERDKIEMNKINEIIDYINNKD